MRNYLFAALVIACQLVFAQDENLNLEKLKPPSSPASNIIGIQPSDINRPKSVKELETALYNNFVSENSLTLPNDYGLEIMPYWILNQKNIDERNYLLQDRFRAMYSNLSLSVASTQNFIISDSVNSNAMGFGIRTILYKSELEEEKASIARKIYLNRLIETLNTVAQTEIDNYSGDFGDYDEVKQFLTSSLTSKATRNLILEQKNWYGYTISGTHLKEAVKSLFIEIEKKDKKPSTQNEWAEVLDQIRRDVKVAYGVEELEKDLTDYLTNRKGLQVEVAGALSLNFPTNMFNYSIVPRWGVWLTLSYQKNEKAIFQYLLMGRYIRNDLNFYSKYNLSDSINYSNSFDIGGKLVILPSKDFTTELEFIGRYKRTEEILSDEGNVKIKSITDNFSLKWVLNISYQIKDNMLLTYNLGRDFDPLLKINGNIISTIGLNVGFGNPKVAGN